MQHILTAYTTQHQKTKQTKKQTKTQFKMGKSTEWKFFQRGNADGQQAE